MLRLVDLPPEALTLLRYGRARRQHPLQAGRLPLPVHDARAPSRRSRRGLRLAGAVGDNHPTYRYERDVEDFFRHSPAVVRPEQ